MVAFNRCKELNPWFERSPTLFMLNQTLQKQTAQCEQILFKSMYKNMEHYSLIAKQTCYKLVYFHFKDTEPRSILALTLGWGPTPSPGRRGRGYLIPCVNLFIGFDLSHAPPKAVLIILVDEVGGSSLGAIWAKPPRLCCAPPQPDPCGKYTSGNSRRHWKMTKMYLSFQWWTCWIFQLCIHL